MVYIAKGVGSLSLRAHGLYSFIWLCIFSCRMYKDRQMLLYRVRKAGKFHPKTQVLFVSKYSLLSSRLRLCQDFNGHVVKCCWALKMHFVFVGNLGSKIEIVYSINCCVL